jgi:hypothetical protein
MPKLPLIALEIFLGFGVPIVWAAWELISLRREREQDTKHEEAGSACDWRLADRLSSPRHSPSVPGAKNVSSQQRSTTDITAQDS